MIPRRLAARCWEGTEIRPRYREVFSTWDAFNWAISR
jgi:hypothetical protein